MIWVSVPFHGTFSRHDRIKASFILLIWLNENVGFHPSFSRHDRIKASFILLIWLNENVVFFSIEKNVVLALTQSSCESKANGE